MAPRAPQRRGQELREAPPPLEGNDLVITLTGTIAWAIALVVLLVLRHQLASGRQWWIWTCVAGVGFGLFGLIYVPHLKRSRARAAARRAAAEEQAAAEQAAAEQAADQSNS
jgi:type VI protein secretion system component VasK